MAKLAVPVRNIAMSPYRALLNAAKIVLLFVLFGPLIGLPILATGFGIASRSLSIVAFFAIYGIVFAHLMGGLPALAAGLGVAAFAAWKGPVPLWFAALAGAAASVITPGLELKETQDGVAITLVIVVPMTCILASIACTMLSRSWQHAVRVPVGA